MNMGVPAAGPAGRLNEDLQTEARSQGAWPERSVRGRPPHS